MDDDSNPRDPEQPGTSRQLTPTLPNDWTLCILCQTKKSEPLQCPGKSKRSDCGSGYSTLAKNLERFSELGSIPMQLNISRLDEGKGIEHCLKCNEASWHKSCYLKLNATAIKRAERKRQAAETLTEGSAAKYKRQAAETLTEGNAVKYTRTHDVVSSTASSCFFCGKEGKPQELRSASTFQLDSRVRECALRVQDKKLLARLSSGDLIAQEAKYHPGCLTDLYRRAKIQSIDKEFTEQDNMNCSLVFAELVEYIDECRQTEKLPVFKLAELTTLYADRLKQLGEKTEGRIHSTRLKDRLLAHFHDLQAHQEGRDILLAFDEHVGGALKDAFMESYDDEAIHLAKAAKLVRKDMFNMQSGFCGSFDDNCQTKSIPQSLIALVSMILEGPSIKSHNSAKRQSALTIAQLLKFNSSKYQRDDISGITRHNKDMETPLPLYLGMAIHAKTRKRDLIDTFFSLGLSVSYDRVLEVSTDLSNKACSRFEEEKVVCPTKLKAGLFTTSAVDNIDHNPSATSAQDSFHGTGISLFQHPTVDNEGTVREHRGLPQDVPERHSKTVSNLPDFYANVPPAILSSTTLTLPEVEEVQSISRDKLREAKCKEKRWFDWVKTAEEQGVTDNISWGAYHAVEQEPTSADLPAICSLLPLFPDQAKSPAMIKHAMNVIKQAVEHINPGQVPVIAADQPLFALAKQIQWKWPETHGEEKFVIQFGGLHIEMAFLKVLGDWLRDSGWTESLVEAKVASSGVADSFLKASHVTRTRRAHQVTACTLYILLQKAYTHYCTTLPEGSDPLAIAVWSSKACACPTFHFWWIVLSLELLLLIFVLSLREGNFPLYVEVLDEMVPWFFALDHTNYARWLPIHIRDMATLHKTHPEVTAEFEKGHFVVNKTAHSFSRIPTDQAHEQNNASVKGEGGAIGITQNQAALRRWTVGGPEIARLVQEFEMDMTQRSSCTKHDHHEQKRGQQAAFAKDVHALVQVIEGHGQPFLEHSDELIILQSKDIADQSVKSTVEKVKKTGQDQYQTFVRDRLVERTITLSHPIKRNKLPLISRPCVKQPSKSKMQIATLRSDCNLFSRLYISCQTRDGNLEDFFRHENQPCPPSLSHLGSLRLCAKSSLLQCLEDLAMPTDEMPAVDVTILDGAAIVNMLKPNTAKTFAAYAHDVFVPHLRRHLQHTVKRLDLVWDQYHADSLKATARERRGKGVRRRVEANTTIPGNWQEFLRIDDNKCELFMYLSELAITIESDKQVISTYGERVLCAQECDTTGLQPCQHEEADTRMMLHLMDATKQGCNSALLRTVDTDVVVLAITAVSQLNINELWVAFGVGKTFRYLPAHDMAANLGPLRSRSLPMFHSITGCDTVSSFNGIGKKTAWHTWQTFDDVTTSFLSLSSAPLDIAESDMAIIERFVILMYDRTSNQTDVNGARQQLFTRRDRSIDNIPPTQAALKEHVRRAVYQGGHIWGQTFLASPELPNPGDWGWKRNSEEKWEPNWTTLPEASRSCHELLKCGCTKGCKGRCKCYKAALRCTALCKCSAECDNDLS